MSSNTTSSKSRSTSKLLSAKCSPIEYNDYTEIHASVRNDLIEFGSVMLPPWMQHDGQTITSIDISPDGSRVITSGLNKRVFLWNASVLNSVYCEERPDTAVCAAELSLPSAANTVRFSPDGMYIAAAQDDGCIAIFRQDYAHDPSVPTDIGSDPLPERWLLATTVKAHNSPAIDLAWSPDGHRLACTSVDNNISIWDVAPLTPHAKSSPLLTHNLDNDTALLTTPSATAAARGVEAKPPTRVALLRGHNTWVTGVAWDPLYQYLATQDEAGVIIIWSATRFEMVRKLSAHLNKPAGSESLAPLGQTTGAAGNFQFNFSRISFSADGSLLCACKGFNFASATQAVPPGKTKSRENKENLPPRGQCVSVVFSRGSWVVDTQLVGHAQPTTAAAYNPRLFKSGDDKALSNLTTNTTTTSTSTTSSSSSSSSSASSEGSSADAALGNAMNDADFPNSETTSPTDKLSLSDVESDPIVKYLCPTISLPHSEGIPSVRHTQTFKLAATSADFKSRASQPSVMNLIAIGSADGCISIWSSAYAAPLIVLDRMFDAAVMDLRWGADGYTLYACSHSGEALQLRFGIYDLGIPLSDDEIYNALVTKHQVKVLANSVYAPSNVLAPLRPYFYVHSFLNAFSLDNINRGYESIDSDTDFNEFYRNLMEKRRKKKNGEEDAEGSFLEFDLREICPENKAFLIEYLRPISHMTSIPLPMFLVERRLNRAQRLLIDTTVFPSLDHTALLTNDPEIPLKENPAFSQTHSHCFLTPVEDAQNIATSTLGKTMTAHVPTAAPTIHVLKPVSKRQRLLGAQPGGSVAVSASSGDLTSVAAYEGGFSAGEHAFGSSSTVAGSEMAADVTSTTAASNVMTLQSRSKGDSRRATLAPVTSGPGNRLDNMMGTGSHTTTTGFGVSVTPSSSSALTTPSMTVTTSHGMGTTISAPTVTPIAANIPEITATVTKNIVAMLTEALTTSSADPAVNGLLQALHTPARVAAAAAVDAQVHKSMATAALPLLAAMSRQCLGAPIVSHYSNAAAGAHAGLGALAGGASDAVGMGLTASALASGANADAAVAGLGQGPVSGLVISASTAASMPWYQLTPMLPVARVSLLQRRSLSSRDAMTFDASDDYLRAVAPMNHQLSSVDANVTLESSVSATFFDMLLGEPAVGELSGKNVLQLLSLLQKHNKVYASVGLEDVVSFIPTSPSPSSILSTIVGEKPMLGQEINADKDSDAAQPVLRGFGNDAAVVEEEEQKSAGNIQTETVHRWRTLIPGLPVGCVHNKTNVAVCAMEPNLAAISQHATMSAASKSGHNSLFDLVNLVQSSVYTLHLYSDKGTSLMPPIALPAPLHSMSITDTPLTSDSDGTSGLISKLMVLLADATVMVFDLIDLKLDMKSNISHLLTATVTPPTHTISTTVLAGTSATDETARGGAATKDSKKRKTMSSWTPMTTTVNTTSNTRTDSTMTTISSAATLSPSATSTAFPTMAFDVFQRHVRAAQRQMLAAAYLSPNGVPLVSLSSQQTYLYHPELKVWVRATDAALPHGTLREYSQSMSRAGGGLVESDDAVLSSIQRALLNKSVIEACVETGGKAEAKYTFASQRGFVGASTASVGAAVGGEAGAGVMRACSEWNHWEQQLVRCALMASRKEYQVFASNYVTSLCRYIQNDKEIATEEVILIAKLASEKLNSFLSMLTQRGAGEMSQLSPTTMPNFPYGECVQSLCSIMAMYVNVSPLAQHYLARSKDLVAMNTTATLVDDTWLENVQLPF